jgi:hypothetical protein
MIEQRSSPVYCNLIEIFELTPGMFNSDLLAIERAPNGKPWFTDIREYIEHQTYPKHATENDKKTIRRLAMQFVARGCDSPSWGKSFPYL